MQFTNAILALGLLSAASATNWNFKRFDNGTAPAATGTGATGTGATPSSTAPATISGNAAPALGASTYMGVAAAGGLAALFL